MTPDKQLAQFMSKYAPALRAVAVEVLSKMRERLPGAVELVYDNYNALVITFGPSERVSHVIFSIALYPRWVTLFFKDGAALADPRGLLQGSGKAIRHIVLEGSATLQRPAVRALMRLAIDAAPVAIDAKAPRRTIIRSVSAKQRARRPARDA